MKATRTLTLISIAAITLSIGVYAEARGNGGKSEKGGDGSDRQHDRGNKDGGVDRPNHDKNHDRGPDKDRGDRSPGVNRREENQHDRIGQGIKSGQLTKEETKELASEQKEIRQEEKEYKSDGTLTKDERKDLHQDLSEASKDIYEEKHDSETREKTASTEPKKSGTKDPGINGRQERQRDRLAEGVKSGELTKKEARTLAGKEVRLIKIEKALKEEGLSPKERIELQKKLNDLNQEIYQQKHDTQDRP